MVRIPIEVAERIYAIYSTTLMSPISFEEMFPVSGAGIVVAVDTFWRAFERGIVKPEEQLAMLRSGHAKAANPDEAYDLGMRNGLELAMFVITGREPEFQTKPDSLLGEMADLKKEHKEKLSLLKKASSKIKELQEKLTDDTKKDAGKATKKKK